ncbi:MAG: putative selenate reductase subunit YgfK, partial [Calditrichia bacterium]|nr:putative selenate reductase subunit YgfK [Calditrichia bacterium]
KLSNTLGVNNPGKPLAGEQMYMSGRALFPLTINLAAKLAEEFKGDLKISYSGGANYFNIEEIIETGIFPITMATDLLKPGGYGRLFQIAKKSEEMSSKLKEITKINLQALNKLAKTALTDNQYNKAEHGFNSVKTDKKLGKFDCYIAPCQEACPINQDVSEYIRLMEEERPVEAFETIIRKNPLPHITGYICDHQCMTKCTRLDYDASVYIREIKKNAAESVFSTYLKKFKNESTLKQKKKKGIKAAIIGAGPAGLAAAYFLVREGFEVTVFEKEKKAGGTVQNVIPDFRLTEEAITNDIDFIKAHGVKFKFGVDENFSVEKLKKDGFKYIFIGIGAMKPSPLEIPGKPEMMFEATRFLRDFKAGKKIDLGKNVAVIGGGNSAMDGARAALRCKGVENVSIVYRRTIEFMPADKEELDAALAENVKFMELLSPVEFTGGTLKCQKMKLGKKGADGRRKVSPIEGEFTNIEIYSVISAIGEKVETKHLTENKLMDAKTGNMKIDKITGECAIENVYLGGDALRGPATVVEAIADGKKSAEAICKKENIDKTAPLNGNNFSEIIDIKKWENDVRLKKAVQYEGKVLSGHKETQRCLGCKYFCNKCVDVCPNRANAAIATDDDNFKDSYQILHLDGLCNECGNCEVFCPNTGAPYKDKTTLFQNEKDFRDSKNDGFLLLSENKENAINFNFKIRFDGNVSMLTYSPENQSIFTSFENSSTEFVKFKSLLIKVVDEYSYLMV